MKTTVELDEKRLKRIMACTGLRTKKAALDYALREVERMELKRHLYNHPSTADELAGAIDPHYDLTALRKQEMPPLKRRR